MVILGLIVVSLCQSMDMAFFCQWLTHGKFWLASKIQSGLIPNRMGIAAEGTTILKIQIQMQAYNSSIIAENVGHYAF